MALVSAAPRLRRWSDVLRDVSNALADPSADERLIWFAVDNEALADLARPFSRLPFISESHVPLSENAAEQFFKSELARISNRTSQVTDIDQLVTALRRCATEMDERETIANLQGFHGARARTVITKSDTNSQALCLYFNQRRALLMTLDLLLSEERAVKIRNKLVEDGLVVSLCTLARKLTEAIAELPTTENALLPELQAAQYMLERKLVLRACFFLSLGCHLTQEQVFSLVDLTKSLASSRTRPLDGKPFTPATNAEIMKSPSEKLFEWIIWERSNLLECLSLALCCCAAAPETFNWSVLQSPMEVQHEGVLGFLYLCKAAAADIGEKEEALKTACDKRAFSFIRCLLRSCEFRGESTALLQYMQGTIVHILREPIKWVAANGMNGNESHDESDSALNEIFVSRSDKRNSRDQRDFLEDVVECIISVLKLTGSCGDFAIRFFDQTDMDDQSPFNGFLRHCQSATGQLSFFALLRALVVAGGSDSQLSISAVDVLGWNFFSDTVHRIVLYRDKGDGAAELRSSLALFSHLISSLPDEYIGRIEADQLYFMSENRRMDLESDGFVQLLTSILTHKGLTDMELKISIMYVLAAFASRPTSSVGAQIVEGWKKSFTFSGFENVPPTSEGRIDLRSQLQNDEGTTHTYGFTRSTLELAKSLIIRNNASQSLAPLLRFVVEDVFFRFDERVYSHPGERWIVCRGCLELFVAAVTTCKEGTLASDPLDAGYTVMTYFLRESPLFVKLIGILNAAGNGDAAPGLENVLVHARRNSMQNVDTFNARRDWYIGEAVFSSGLKEQATTNSSSANYGPFFYTAQANQGQTGPKYDHASAKLVQEWLSLVDPQPLDEPPWLWDDGDTLCQARIECVQLVLTLLRAFIDRQDQFMLWCRNALQSGLPLRVETLLLSQPRYFVSTLSSYIGCGASAECRMVALTILDRVSRFSNDKDRQVFAWVSQDPFLTCLSSPGTRDTAFEFMYKHRPSQLMRKAAPYLIKLALTASERSRTCSDAVHALTIICVNERESGMKTVIPSDLPSQLIQRCVRNADLGEFSNQANSELLRLISWTLRLAEAAGRDLTSIFRRSRDLNAASDCEVLLSSALAGMARGTTVANVASALEAWRMLVENRSNRLYRPLMIAVELLQAYLDSGKNADARACLEISRISLLLIRESFSNGLSQPLSFLTSRDDMFTIASRIMDAVIVAAGNEESEIFSNHCAALMIMNTISRYVPSSGNTPEMQEQAGLVVEVARRAIKDAIAASGRASSLFDACVSVIDRRRADPQSQTLAAHVLAKLLPESGALSSWVEAASRKGLLQSVVNSAVGSLFEMKEQEYPIEYFKRCNNSAAEAIIGALRILAQASKDACSVISDALLISWRQASPLFADARSTFRAFVREDSAAASIRSTLAIALLGLVVTISETDPRFGLGFLRMQKGGVILSLTSVSTEADIEESFLLLSLLCHASLSSSMFAAELSSDREYETELIEASVHAMCTGVARLKPVSPTLIHTQRKCEVRMIRAALLFLSNRAINGGAISVDAGRRRDLVGSLMVLVQLYVDSDTLKEDLVKALLLLYVFLVRFSESKEILKDLAKLFPRAVGGNTSPSSLERLADATSGTLMAALCNKLTELRFRS